MINNQKQNYPSSYWDAFYEKNKLGWDIGSVSTPLKEYFDQLENRDMKILIPGAGNGYEVEYLYKQGFSNTFLLDFSQKAISSFKNRYPYFPNENIICQDFFQHQGNYDLIVEQTFLSSLPKSQRERYVNQVHRLLLPGGKVMGLLFNHEFPYDYPPFGGTPDDYRKLFAPFRFKIFETAYNSIKPRRNRELFFIFEKTPPTSSNRGEGSVFY